MAVKKYLSIWGLFISRNLQSKMAYRLDFIVGIVANTLMQCIGFLAIWVIFNQVEDLAGWSYHEVLLMYGVASISSGLSEFFLDGVWSIGNQFIRKGELDRLLTRPMNPLISILISKMEPHGLGQILFGVVLVIKVVLSGTLSFPAVRLCVLPLVVLCGAIIYLSINLTVASFGFFATKVMGMQVLVHHMNSFSKYPLPLYHKLIRILISWVIPFAFTSYYPTAWILQKKGWIIGCLCPAVAVILLFLSYQFWKWGLRHYQSAGG